MGLGVSFDHFFREIFSSFNITPTLLTPIGKTHMVGSFLSGNSTSLNGAFSLDAFQSIYHPMKGKNKVNLQKEYYYLLPCFRLCPKFVITPNKVNNWKQSFSLPYATSVLT